jgi:hypothetical protein
MAESSTTEAQSNFGRMKNNSVYERSDYTVCQMIALYSTACIGSISSSNVSFETNSIMKNN